MPVRVGQSDPNQTPFLITLTYNDVDYADYVTYIPDSSGITPPAVPSLISRNPASEYYYVYSVDGFLNSVNTCIDGIMTLLRTATGIATASPYFVFDANTQTLGFVCSYDFFTKAILVSFNNTLYKYFQFFRWSFNSDSTNGKDNTLVITDSVMNWWALPGTAIDNPPEYLFVSEETSTSVINWFAVKSIVVTTDSVPVMPEYVPVVGASNSGIAGVASRQIITDFEPNFASVGDARTVYSFSQTGPYRVTPLLLDLPLSRFDLRVFWTDANGNFIPWQLGPGESANFKILFIRKDTFRA